MAPSLLLPQLHIFLCLSSPLFLYSFDSLPFSLSSPLLYSPSLLPIFLFPSLSIPLSFSLFISLASLLSIYSFPLLSLLGSPSPLSFSFHFSPSRRSFYLPVQACRPNGAPTSAALRSQPSIATHPSSSNLSAVCSRKSSAKHLSVDAHLICSLARTCSFLAISYSLACSPACWPYILPFSHAEGQPAYAPTLSLPGSCMLSSFLPFSNILAHCSSILLQSRAFHLRPHRIFSDSADVGQALTNDK